MPGWSVVVLPWAPHAATCLHRRRLARLTESLWPLREAAEWWNQAREALKNVPLLKTDLQAITRDRAQLNLHYDGDAARLDLAFAQQGLVATQDGSVWMISLPHQQAAPTQ